MNFNQVHCQLFAHEDKKDRADDWSSQRAQPADERNEQSIKRPDRAERCGRIVADLLKGKYAARQTCKETAQSQGKQFMTEHMDACCLRRAFIFTYCQDAEAPRRTEQ